MTAKVVCYDLVPLKSKYWNRERDQFLRDHYNDKLKIEPAMLADSLGLDERRVINRLSELGLRNRRREQNVNKRVA